MSPEIFPQLPKIHPLRHKLERLERDAFKWHDVYMVETFPHQGLLAECLGDLLGFGNRAEDVEMSYLFNCHLIAHGGYPKSFNANTPPGEGTLEDIAKSAVCDRWCAGGNRKPVRYFKRWGENHPRTANFL